MASTRQVLSNLCALCAAVAFGAVFGCAAGTATPAGDPTEEMGDAGVTVDGAPADKGAKNDAGAVDSGLQGNSGTVSFDGKQVQVARVEASLSSDATFSTMNVYIDLASGEYIAVTYLMGAVGNAPLPTFDTTTFPKQDSVLVSVELMKADRTTKAYGSGTLKTSHFGTGGLYDGSAEGTFKEARGPFDPPATDPPIAFQFSWRYQAPQ